MNVIDEMSARDEITQTDLSLEMPQFSAISPGRNRPHKPELSRIRI
jgi:hypothetical protein